MARILQYTNLPHAAQQRRRDQVLSLLVLGVALGALLGLCLPLIRVIFQGLL